MHECTGRRVDLAWQTILSAKLLAALAGSVAIDAMLAMVIVGLLSDTHGQTRTAAAALEMLRKRGAEYLIHSGDICGEEILEQMAETPGAFVFGNNDFEFERYRQLAKILEITCLNFGGMITLDGKKIAVAHGDRATEMRQLISQRPDYFIFGHTHVPLDTMENGIRYINPGALHRARPKMCAILDLKMGKLESIEVAP